VNVSKPIDTPQRSLAEVGLAGAAATAENHHDAFGDPVDGGGKMEPPAGIEPATC
jgi:hypothetical protein